MKKTIITSMTAIALLCNAAFGYVYVNGYTKSNGTYVAPYVRTSPDAYEWNNFSY